MVEVECGAEVSAHPAPGGEIDGELAQGEGHLPGRDALAWAVPFDDPVPQHPLDTGSLGGAAAKLQRRLDVVVADAPEDGFGHGFTNFAQQASQRSGMGSVAALATWPQFGQVGKLGT